MLQQNTLDKIQELKLLGMLEAWNNISSNNQYTDLTAGELLSILIDHEVIYRKNKKQTRLLKQAKLRFKDSSLENISKYSSLNRQQINQLKDMLWLKNKQNIIITGPTGVGKTYLACAIAQRVCCNGYSAMYYKLSRLLELLRIANADGSYLSFLAKTTKVNCLVIDDWAVEPMPELRRNNLLDIVDDLYQHGSTIITSQLPVEHWHDYIGEPMVADAILDRLINNAVIFNLTGESIRKKS